MVSGDRALRKMIAELAEMSAPARSAVLEYLDDAQRDAVGTLLDEYRGDHRPPPVNVDRHALPPGLSPWLVEMLGDNEGAALRRDDAALTPGTFDALRACTAGLTPAANGPEQPRRFWQTLMERLSACRDPAGAR